MTSYKEKITQEIKRMRDYLSFVKDEKRKETISTALISLEMIINRISTEPSPEIAKRLDVAMLDISNFLDEKIPKN